MFHKGDLFQRGYGIGGYHKGHLFQRGYGLGGIFRSVIRHAIPAVKTFLKSDTGKALKNIGLSTASNTISDLMSGEQPKEVALKNLKTAKRKITKLVKSKLSKVERPADGKSVKHLHEKSDEGEEQGPPRKRSKYFNLLS